MKIIKKIVPSSVKKKLRGLIEDQAVSRLKKDWAAQRAHLAAPTQEVTGADLKKVLIVPTDPWTLIGAVGDDAMISSSVGMVRRKNATAEMYVITGDEAANKVAREIGLIPLMIWKDKNYCQSVVRAINDHAFDAVIVLGADVVDGYYGAVIAAKLVVTADLAARLGAKVTVLGFSFNSNPVASLHYFFQNLHENVKLHVRESVSETRFKQFSTHPVKLVADSAFMLQPQSNNKELVRLKEWVEERRSTGRIVLGMNVHPMLIKQATSEQVLSIVAKTAEAMQEICTSFPVSWVLIPHDYRDGHGDDVCLLPVADKLREMSGVDFHYIAGKHRAAVLKAMAGEVDGVVAGRMHLIIASLGMGTPVFALKYQDKFEGLLRLFGLPQEMAITADELLDGKQFGARLNNYVRELQTMRASVANALPSMLEASKTNFSVVLN